MSGFMVQFTGTFPGTQKEMQDLVIKHGGTVGKFYVKQEFAWVLFLQLISKVSGWDKSLACEFICE